MVFNPFKPHEKQWLNCTKCPLGCLANKHVLYDFLGPNKRNVDILMIGEAPGVGEDTIGRPFVGKSGKLLRKSLEQIGVEDLSICITNVVACKPQDQRGGKIRKPEWREEHACKPRIEQLYKLVNPKSVLLIGSVARDALLHSGIFKGTPVELLRHPAYVLYNGGEGSNTHKAFHETLTNFITFLREQENAIKA